MVLQALRVHPLTEPGLAQDLHRAVLEDPRTHALLDVLPVARLEHHRGYAVQVEQVGEQQPCGTSANDAYLDTHQSSPTLAIPVGLGAAESTPISWRRLIGFSCSDFVVGLRTDLRAAELSGACVRTANVCSSTELTWGGPAGSIAAVVSGGSTNGGSLTNEEPRISV